RCITEHVLCRTSRGYSSTRPTVDVRGASMVHTIVSVVASWSLPYWSTQLALGQSSGSCFFFFSSRRRHTIFSRDWSSDVCSSDLVIEKFDEVVNAFAAGRCDVFSTDASGLASIRSSRLAKPDDYIVLPEIISKEPLGPMVRQGDDRWLNIVKWSLYAMLEAEEYGITSANVDEMRKSASPSVQRILGVTPGAGKSMGID